MTIRLSLPSPRRPTGRELASRVSPTVLVFVGLAVAVFSGWAVARGSTMLVAPIAGLALYVVFAPTTLAPFAAVLIAASTFTSAYALPKTAHFYPVELLVLLALALLPFSNYRRFGGGTGVLMVALLAAVFEGVEVARVNGIPTLAAFDGARPMIIYASFWVALAALRANPNRFLKMIAAFAVLIVLLSVAQFLLPGHTLFRSSGETFVTPQPGGFTRVRPPGLVLVYFGLIFAGACALWGPTRHRRRALAFGALTGVGILISLNRNMLVGALIGLVVALILSRRRSRALLALAGAALVVAAVLAFAGSGAIGSRILSLGNPSGLQATTLSDRQYEDSLALPVIERHPFFGIGWGASYGAQLALPGSGTLTVRGFIHNQYYGLLLRTGILGFVAYLGLLGSTALIGLRWLRARAESEDAWLGHALLASVVAFASSAIVGIYVIDAGSTAIVAALFALGVLLRERLSLNAPALAVPPALPG